MRKRIFRTALVAMLGAVCVAPFAAAAESKVFLQTDITAARIVVTGNRYAVDVTLLASDFEEMFQKSLSELKGVDLSAPGILEIEIGRFVARRVAMRDGDGNVCPSKVERSGEDPANDEAVLVSLTFECAGTDVVYDASKFLAALSPRAWQVVTVLQGDTQRQIMLGAESPGAKLLAAR